MRFVTWNMGCGPGSTFRSMHEVAWGHLLECLKPDVALVQEALQSVEGLVQPFGSLIWSAKGPHGGRSGTGIFVRRGIEFETSELVIPGSYAAWVTIAFRGMPTRVATVHVGPERWTNLTALRDWLVGDLLPLGPCVVGGDFNSSRSLAPRHRKYLDGLSESGLHDCHWALHRKESPSFWGRQGRKIQYQDDHFFTSGPLGSFVRGCDVDAGIVARRVSDHGPVVLELSEAAG